MIKRRVIQFFTVGGKQNEDGFAPKKEMTSICKTIVREHHGKLAIENHGDGTWIIIQLPLNS